MSDTNYMNAYVNLVMETVHTNLNDILQLKTQTKLLNDLVLEKDQVISSLNQQLEESRVNQTDNDALQAEMQRLRDNAATWETQYNNMYGKVSHMDTLVKQFNDLQKEHVENINNLNRSIDELNALRSKTQEYEQQITNLNSELESATKKIDRLTKKEEKETKKIVAAMPSKTDINKEEPKSISTPQKVKPVVVEKLKETDDDF